MLTVAAFMAALAQQGMWEPGATGLGPRDSLGALARALHDDKAGVRRAASKTLHSRVRRLVRAAERRGFAGEMAASELFRVEAEVVPACAASLADPVVVERCADILGWVPVEASLGALEAARATASAAALRRLDAAADAIRAALSPEAH